MFQQSCLAAQYTASSRYRSPHRVRNSRKAVTTSPMAPTWEVDRVPERR